MIDLTKPLRTRDGRRTTIIKTDSDLKVGGYYYPIVADVEHPNDPNELVRWHYMSNGQFKSNDSNNHNDLVNERFWHRILGKVTGWKS